jgi:signal transduction histidine kinase
VKQSSLRRLPQWINSGMRRRLAVLSVVFWVVSVSVVSLTFLRVGQNQIVKQTRERNTQLASIISRELGSQLSTVLTDTRLFARHLELLGPDMANQSAAIVALRLSAPQRYSAVYYFDDHGGALITLTDPPESLLASTGADIVSRTPAAVDNNVLSTFLQARTEGTFVSDVYFTVLDRTPILYVGLRLNMTGGIARVVVLQVDLQDMWQRLNQVTVGNTGFVYVVSDRGIIIAHPNPAYLGQQVAPQIAPLVSGHEGFAEYDDSAVQREVLAAYSSVGGPTGWGIVVQQDIAETNAAVFTAGAYVVGIWLAVAIIGTAGILIAVGNLTKPIVALTQTTRDIAQTGNLRKTDLAERTDELGQLSRSFDQMIDRLQTTEGKLEHAAAEERNRLARDLHDAVSQTLFSASIIAEVLPRLWEKNQAEGRRRLEEIRQLTRGALAEMRTLLFELRPSALADAEMNYLLRQLVESFISRHGIPVELKIETTCSIPTEAKIVFYRIAQEALNNVAKHAEATQVRVTLSCPSKTVSLDVADNGRGFDLGKVRVDSLGLGIMRDRAAEIGASVSIDSRQGSGTIVRVTWAANESVGSESR